MLCQLRLLSNFIYTPLLCHYGMLVCSAKIIILLLLVFHSFPPSSPSRVTTWWGGTSCSE